MCGFCPYSVLSFWSSTNLCFNGQGPNPTSLKKYGFPISQISIARSVPGLRLYPRRLCACNMKGSSEIIFSTCMPPVVKMSFRPAGLFEPQRMHASTVYTQCHCSSSRCNSPMDRLLVVNYSDCPKCPRLFICEDHRYSQGGPDREV